AQNVMATQSPNRMGPPASISMPLLGLSLIRLAGSSPRRGPSTLFPLLVMILAAVPILGYVFGIREMFGIARYTGIALHTAIALALAALGILLARVDTGLNSL